MILVDTSIWIDHFRKTDHVLEDLLIHGRVLSHPLVVGELAVGNLRSRESILKVLRKLPRTETALDHEVLSFIERHKLFGLGIGYIDAHLLAAVQLTPDVLLWTRDKRLNQAAAALGLSMKTAYVN